MNLLFSCRFLSQVTLITNPHRKENLDLQNNDVGKGVGTKTKHQNSLKHFIFMLDPLRLTNRSFRLEESLPTPCIKVSNVKQQQQQQQQQQKTCLRLFADYFSFVLKKISIK